MSDLKIEMIRLRIGHIRGALNDPNAACWVTNDDRALVDLAALVECLVRELEGHNMVKDALKAMTYNQRLAFEALKKACPL